jgi:hypothetical protein
MVGRIEAMNATLPDISPVMEDTLLNQPITQETSYGPVSGVVGKEKGITYFSLRKRLEEMEFPSGNAQELPLVGAEPGKTYYNPSAPVEWEEGKMLIALRKEDRDKEDAVSEMWQIDKDGKCEPYPGGIKQELQDPRIGIIEQGEKKICWFAGVEVDWNKKTGLANSWRVVFYRGDSFKQEDMKLWFKGPRGMKDICLAGIEGSDEVAVITRPQGGEAKLGRIGMFVATNMDEVTPENIARAPLLKMELPETEWVGGNWVQAVRKDGQTEVRILGHGAYYMDDGMRRYFPISIVTNGETGEVKNLKILGAPETTVKSLDSQAKRDELNRIFFPGGIVREEEGGWRIVAGVNDYKAVTVEVPKGW